MHTIITGEINTGKTTKLIELFRKSGGQGDGFAARKIVKNGRVQCYEALRLSSGETALLAAHQDYAVDLGAIAFTVGPYRFRQTTVQWMEMVCDRLAKRNAGPVYFDEIGKLELAGEGFDETVRKLAQIPEAVFVVRQVLLQRAIKRYGLKQYNILKA